MNCRDYKQNILLLVHNELGFVDRMRVTSHISRCAGCRQEYESMRAISDVIANAVRTPGMPRWSPAAPPRLRRIPLGSGLIIILTLILIGGVLTGTVVGVIHARAKGGGYPKCTTGCMPGLHSDRCR
jgi:hypothetical protein